MTKLTPEARATLQAACLQVAVASLGHLPVDPAKRSHAIVGFAIELFHDHLALSGAHADSCQTCGAT